MSTVTEEQLALISEYAAYCAVTPMGRRRVQSEELRSAQSAVVQAVRGYALQDVPGMTRLLRRAFNARTYHAMAVAVLGCRNG